MVKVLIQKRLEFKAICAFEAVYNYDDIKDGILKLWNTALIRPEKMAEAKKTALKLVKYKPRFEIVSKATGVPWFVVALISHMESDCNFTTHLHNGDSLKKRTIQVPAGRPKTGTPPFTWEVSAIDALGYDHFTEVTDWCIERILFMLEAYNGFGYRSHKTLSCYVWAGSSVQTKGRYVADGKFDANAWSERVGCAALLKQLILMGEITVTTKPLPTPIPAPIPAPAPAPSTVQYNVAVLAEAHKWVGTKESGGNNHGTQVELFQKAVDGVAEGEPWCMAFIQFCVKQVEVELNIHSLIKRSEHCLTVFRNSPASLRSTEPQIGCIVIWQHGTSERGHTGIIHSVCDDGTIITVEGNTNADGSSDGDGVYIKKRHLKGDGDMHIVGYLKAF